MMLVKPVLPLQIHLVPGNTFKPYASYPFPVSVLPRALGAFNFPLYLNSTQHK